MAKKRTYYLASIEQRNPETGHWTNCFLIVTDNLDHAQTVTYDSWLGWTRAGAEFPNTCPGWAHEPANEDEESPATWDYNGGNPDFRAHIETYELGTDIEV